MTAAKVRSSSLPTHGDCARRWAAQQPGLVPKSYGLRPLAPHVGAVVGKAVHSGGEHLLTELMQTGRLAVPAALEVVETQALELTADRDIRYDRNGWTPHRDAAVWAARSVMATYAETVDPELPPLIAPEHALSMRIRDLDLIVTAHVDLFGQDRIGEDTKTGRHLRTNYGAQFGAYAWQLRSNAYDPRPFFREKHIPRPKYPGGRATAAPRGRITPRITLYEAPALERVAHGTLKAIRRDLDMWERTGDPDSFSSNPHSALCSADFCPAHGSAWCHAWKLKGKPDG